MWVVVVIHVCKERVATRRTAIPGVHRVDRLRKLGTTLLVYAARVDPHELVSIREGASAAPPDFRGDVGEDVARMSRVEHAVHRGNDFADLLVGLFTLSGPYV